MVAIAGFKWKWTIIHYYVYRINEFKTHASVLEHSKEQYMLCNVDLMSWCWHISARQVTGLDAWASSVKCPARFMSHLHKICIYMSCLWLLFVLLFVHYCKVMVCVVYWVGKWQPRSRGSTSMFGNLMAIYYIMLQFIQNHSRFVMLMIWK